VSDQRTATSASRDDTVEPVSLLRRFVALLIDWILCLLISALFGDPRRSSWIPLVVLVIEYAFFIGLFAQTPGMFVRSIRCVSVTTGGPVGILRAGLRGILLCLVIPPLIMDGDHRGLHDRWTGTVVVDAPRKPRPTS
jgi:uncharacterized RDD family membrane protein YckC